ncbi:MAG: zf-HC2 domain-containing protein [Gammaproteobacteria bacterium]|nr:zf-HC2 domain-containing protein [Gammaproteobacteria bacterium]MCY4357983.1 zf-HC2 domain-containing protein [Gammaproteobacteria bacterium]
MSTSNESKCYSIRLQFDSYLDGEMSENRQEAFLWHLNSCADCAAEFRYAKTVQDSLLDLPMMDCSEATVDQAKRFAAATTAQPEANGWRALLQWLGTMPVSVRYAIPMLAIVVYGLIILPPEQSSTPSGPVARVVIPAMPDESATIPLRPVGYNQRDITQALNELVLAIEYLNQVSERAEELVGGRFLRPFSGNLDATFERIRFDADEELAGDEI